MTKYTHARTSASTHTHTRQIWSGQLGSAKLTGTRMLHQMNHAEDLQKKKKKKKKGKKSYKSKIQ